MDGVEAAERAVAFFCAETAGLTVADLGRPTPCSGWDVGDLVGHVGGFYEAVTKALHGVRVDLVSAAVDLGDDPRDVVDGAATRMLQAWREPGALDRTLVTTIGEMPAALATRIVTGDSLLHAWDLARALGRDVTMSEELAAAQLTLMQQYYDPATRGPGRGFDVAVDWPDDAPVQERLLALSGRDPTWSTATPGRR
jgi:uncharacterized protein (TIGR03086 family)